jgi:hypothetical protein
MLKKLFILIFSFVFFASFTSLFAQKASYIGTKKCKVCHSKDGSYDVWAKSKHATGFKTLQNEESKKISKGKAADQNAACLSCHTLPANKEEGVGCEVCHGPGSNHIKAFKNKTISKSAEILIPKNDSKMCENCHNKKSPTYKEFKYNIEWKKINHPVKKS